MNSLIPRRLAAATLGLLGGATLMAAPAAAATPVIGYVDTVNITPTSLAVTGWSCSSDEPDRVVAVKVYNRSRLLGTLSASGGRESEVGGVCGNNSNHGFSGTIASPCIAPGKATLVQLKFKGVYGGNAALDRPLPGAHQQLPKFTYGC